MKKTILLLIISAAFFSCQKSKEASKIVNADALLGKWESNSPEGNLSETWTKVNDSLFTAESYFIKEKDTLHSEKMKLQQKGEQLLYISTIKGQNNNEPLTFVYNPEIQKQLVFENPKNDYPKKIVYRLIKNDSLVVSISGVQLGQPSTESYGMKKSID